MKYLRPLRTLLLVLALLLAPSVVTSAADWPEGDATDYDYDAFLMEKPNCPGIYTIQPGVPESGTPTIGFPSIAKQNLENIPTTESPAIIMGAAVPYETRKGGAVSKDMFQLLPGVEKVEAPYSYFRPQVIEEKNTSASTDPTGTHYKLSGFDGTYVILRIDVTQLIAGLDDPATADIDETADYYLHVKQSGNKAMLVAIGEQTDLTFNTDGILDPAEQLMGYGTFAAPKANDPNAAALGSKTGSYSLANAAEALKSTDGADTETPYIDVVLLASGSLVAGGDTSAKDQGDVEISFYVDKQASYPQNIPDTILKSNDPEKPYTTAMSYTKASELAKAQQSGQQTQTSPTLEDLYLEKYFSANPTESKNAATYILKGSDLALETMMAGDSSRQSDKATEYWSLGNALTHTYYDGIETDRTGAIIKLMSEVPVVKGLTLEGTDKDAPKKRTLDVNTFDIQIADNTSGTESTAGLTLKNAWLELMDSNETTGSELAVGNNASMVVDEGGKLIIDKDGQLEVEYDAASQAQQTDQQTKPIASGVLVVKAGGEIENNGVISIEGTEAKEVDPTVSASTQATGKGHIINRGTITNNGCIATNGEFFNVGTLVNNGKYADVIESNDPDKGKFTYHKGIQLAWKDDVTQDGSQTSGGSKIEIRPGILINGLDSETSKYVSDSALINNGDIVLAPGALYNFAYLKNAKDSTINLGVAVNAVIPILPSAQDPTTVTQEKILAEPVRSALLNAYTWDDKAAEIDSAVIENEGTITTALVDVPNNGVLGEIKAPAYLDVTSYDSADRKRDIVQFDNYGTFYMRESGQLVLPEERNFNSGEDIGGIGTLLNCSSVVKDPESHKGTKMEKNATEGGAATLTKDTDVTLPYTTFTASSAPAITLNPSTGIKANDKVAVTGTISAWSASSLSKESAPALAASGTDFNKTISCSEVTSNENIYTFSYADNAFIFPNAGTYRVWYKIINNGDYSEAEPVSLEVTVESGQDQKPDDQKPDDQKPDDQKPADQKTADQKAAASVSEKIAALPSDPAKAGKSDVAAAVNAYKSLSTAAKALVPSSDVEKLQNLIDGQAKAQKTSLKSVKAKKGKKVLVKWKKNSNVSGYQLYYKAKGTKAKKVNIKSIKTLKKTVKKLKAGKKYTFKIRPYTNVERLNNPGTTTKIYGKWSKAKKAKAKK